MNAIVAKIKKILNLATDQSGTPEGEAAALADRMMRAHAISMAEVNTVELDPDPIITDTVKMEASVWRRSLASIIATHCSCQMWYVSARNDGCWVTFCGHKTDVEIAQYLYEICDRQIYAASQEYRAKLPEYVKKRLVCNNFRRSAVAGLNSKLKEIRQAGQAEDGTGSALVLRRKEAVDAWVEQNMKLKEGNSSDFTYNAAGYDAGQNVSLNAALTTDPKKSTKMLEG